MAKKVLSIDLDFRSAAKAAEGFTSDLDDALTKALRQNSGFTQFVKGFKNLDQVTEKFRDKQRKFDLAESLRQKKLNGEIRKHIEDQSKKHKELTDQLAAQADQTSEISKELKEQITSLEEELVLSRQIGDNYDDFLKTHKQLAREVDKERSSIAALSRDLASSADAAKEIHDYFKDLADPAKLADNLEGAAERMGEAFRDGIDVQALSRDLGKGLSKGINTAFKAMSGGSTTIMALGGVIAGAVAAMGVLLAAFIAVDKKVKEFNKDLVRTHGALSVMRVGGGDLNRGLTILNHTMKDLVGNLGVTEEEAKSLFDTLDKGGLPLESFTRGITNANKKQEALQRSLRGMYAAANQMGVGLSEYADNLTNYVNDLSMSVDSVNDSFAAIADMASKSSFGTRRFYSMVVQATSGQASLNTRLEDTGDLLLRMSKIMGAKKAAELTGKFAQGLGGMSTQERLQMSTQSRGGMRDIIKREGRAQTQTFGQRANVGAMSTAFARSGQSAIAAPVVTAIRELQGLTENATAEQREQANQNLQRQIRELSPQNQETLINSLLSSSDGAAQQSGQQLRDVVTLMRGQSDNLAAQTEAMSVFGARGAMAATLARVEGVLGRQFDVSNPRAVQQLIAMENIGQITSEQRQQITRLASSSQSQYEELERMRSQSGELSAEQQSRLEELGFTIERGANGQKRILQATYRDNHQILTRGLPISNPQDIFQLQNEAVGGNKQAMKDEATSIAYQTMDATTSVADILENKVAVYIQRVYEWLNGFLGPMLENLPGIREQREAFEKKRSTVTAFESAIENLQKQSEGDRTRMARLSTTATTATATPEEKRRAEDEIKRIQESQSHRALQVQGLREAVQRIREGNTYDTRVLVPAHLRGQAGGVEGQLTPEAALARTLRRIDGTTAPATPTPAAPATPTPAASGASPATLTPEERQRRLDAVRRARGIAPATTAPATTAPAAVPSNRQAEAATAPTTEAIQGQQDQQADQFQRTLRDNRRRDQRTQRDMERLIKGRDLGDGLASSSLPMAIAVANLKTRVLEGIYKSGGRNADVVQALLSGEATQAQLAMAGEGRASATALNFIREAGLNDFIYRSSGGRGVVTPINREDQVVGMKPGGPIANATGRGTGGNVNISINGGDERRVFEVVRRAIQQAGITPNRVPSGAT